MRHLAMVRRVLARRPWIYWLVVAAVAAGCAIATASVLGGVDDERARWGDTAVVLVADRDVAAGEPLADLLTERRYPIAMIPPARSTSLEAGRPPGTDSRAARSSSTSTSPRPRHRGR